MAAWLFPLITAGVNAMQNVFNGKSQKKTNQQNMDFQREENEKARKYSSDMYDKNNEYNSPKNQMDRLKAAGINPHLAYSNGQPMNTATAQTSAQTSSTPSSRAPQIDVQAGALAQSLQQSALLDAQIQNIKADTTQKLAAANNTNVITGINQIDLDNALNKVTQENTLRNISIVSGTQNQQLTAETIKKVQQETVNLISTNDTIKQTFENLKVTHKLTEQQYATEVTKISVMKAQVDNLRAQSNASNAAAENSREQAKTQTFVRENIKSQTLNNIELGKKYNRENYVGEQTDLQKSKAAANKEEQLYKTAVQQTLQAEKTNQLLDHKITEMEYINAVRAVDAGTAPINGVINTIKNANPLNATTTTHFDDNGDYRGHSTRRNHR